MGSQVCTDCNLTLPLSSYNKCVRHTSGYYYQCKKCRLEKKKAYRKNNPSVVGLSNQRRREKRKNSTTRWDNIQQRYGITKEQYEEMLKSQEGKCALCMQNSDCYHVDHCHETNKVRGILCVSCNTGLGKFKDSTDLLGLAISYLQENK